MNYKKMFNQVIILDYIIVIVYIISTGILSNFLNPRQHIYVYFCLVGLIIFFIYGFKKENTNHHDDKVLKSDVIYLVPILLLLFINSGKLSASTVDSKDVKSSIITNTSSSSNKQTDTKLTNQQVNTKSSSDNVTQDHTDVVINDKNYIDKLDDIDSNIGKYIGKTIKVSGYIYRTDDMDKSTFVLSRLYMYCCVADTEVVGYLSKYDNAESLNTNDWYEVTATIAKATYEKEEMAELNIISLTKIDKPKNEYVY